MGPRLKGTKMGESGRLGGAEVVVSAHFRATGHMPNQTCCACGGKMYGAHTRITDQNRVSGRSR